MKHQGTHLLTKLLNKKIIGEPRLDRVNYKEQYKRLEKYDRRHVCVSGVRVLIKRVVICEAGQAIVGHTDNIVVVVIIGCVVVVVCLARTDVVKSFLPPSALH